MSNTSFITQAEQSALIIVDVQERLAAAMPDGVRDRVVTQLQTLLVAAKTLSVPIIVTEQYPKGLGHTDKGLIPYLAETTPVIVKTSFSSAKADGFLSSLEVLQRKSVILTGMETHICILQTALELQQQGYQVFVVEDAVSSRSKSNQYNALQRLRQAGVIITTVESVIFEWLADASHPEFKALAKLIA